VSNDYTGRVAALGAAMEELVTKAPGGILYVPAALLSDLRHVGSPGDQLHTEFGTQQPHELGVGPRSFAQAMIEVGGGHISARRERQAQGRYRSRTARNSHQQPTAWLQTVESGRHLIY